MTRGSLQETGTPEPLLLYPWQQQAWNQLCQQLESQRLPHALLLKGVPDGGLESFAVLFARYLLCAAPVDHIPCGRCRDCHWMSVATHAGFVHVFPETSDKGVVSKVIKIDQIRSMIDMVTQTVMHGGRKVVVITPADAMNTNAANALLKNLEEPTSNTFFILASTNPARLMATIRSRCQVIDLPLPSLAEADRWLGKHIKNQPQREQLLALAGNNPLQVESWLSDGVIELLLKMENELHDLSRGQCSALQVASLWGKGDVSRRVQWWWQWLALQLKRQIQSVDAVKWPASELQLHQFMQKLLLAKQKLESSANPNELLLLESLLIDWQQIAK
jgi:DNA polymerase-3 subunit delta'